MAYFLAWVVCFFVPLPYTIDLIPEETFDVVAHPWLLWVVTQIFFLYIFGLYDDLRLIRYREIVWFFLAACFLQMLTITSLFYLSNREFPRTVIVLFDVMNLVLLSVWRTYVKNELKKQVFRVLIIGKGPDSTREITEEIEKSPWMGMKIVGLVLRENVDKSPEDEKTVSPSFQGLRYPILGGLREIREVIESYHVEQILFTSQESWKDRALDSIS